MKHTREDFFITLFLSAYENGTWADAATFTPDAVDRTNPAVDRLATRKSDGKTLAIEHTIIEPFVGDKDDFASFDRAFREIDDDKFLVVPGRWIQVFVPVGTLKNQPKKAAQEAIVNSVRCWIKSNRLALCNGASQHPCAITGIPGKLPFDVTLDLKVVPLQRGPVAESGSLHVRRQQVENSLGEVIDKALKKKLPKLVNTVADKRILLLERQHSNLYQQSMLDEIEKLRASCPNLAFVNDIWIMETGEAMFGTAFGGTYLRFELYENGDEARSFDFEGGKLVMKSEYGVGEVM